MRCRERILLKRPLIRTLLSHGVLLAPRKGLVAVRGVPFEQHVLLAMEVGDPGCTVMSVHQKNHFTPGRGVHNHARNPRESNR